MTSIGNIILSREKTSVLPKDLEGTKEPYFVLRSNRTAFTLAVPPATDTVVVRGHNLPGTIRMTATIVDQFTEDKSVLRDTDGIGWRPLWNKLQSGYERRHVPDNWISVHVNGKPYFSTLADSRIDSLEKRANGGDITEGIVRSASEDLIGEASHLMIEHDSQTALVINETDKYVRCSILRREEGQTGSFNVTAYHNDGTEKHEDIAPVLFLAADLIEATNLTLFLDYVRELVSKSNKLSNPTITPQRVRDAIGRRDELIKAIDLAGLARKLLYAPEKPAFLISQ